MRFNARFRKLVYLLIILLTLPGCQKQESALFTLMPSRETGVDFKNAIEETETFNIISYEYLYNGGGLAAADFNNDGLQDLFFSGNMVEPKLYLNQGDWHFIDVTEQANVRAKPGWKTGVTVADVNGDGLPDIYLCYSGPGTDNDRANQLFINNGGNVPTFSERAAEFGLDAIGTFSTQASFFDFDLDGDLDMFLLNHAKITYSPFYNTTRLRNLRHPTFGNRLFRNDNGHFTDISEEAEIHGSGINFGLGISISDVNMDGWPDIYVTNDYEEQDFFYLNNRDGTFRECLKESFRHIARFGMGSDIADYNNDGRPDVFVADMLPEDSYRQKLLKGADEFDKYTLLRDSGYHHQNMRNMLQVNLGNNNGSIPQFSEIGQLAGVSNTDWSWCPLFVDLDNDGWKDLFITNGYLRDYTNMDFLKYTFEDFRKKRNAGAPFDTVALLQQMPSTRLKNYCFQNSSNLCFSNVSKAWGFSEEAVSGSAVYVDLDNDGDQDIVVNNLNDPVFLYKNNANEKLQNHFVKISLKGTGKNTFAVGAKVFIRTDTIVQLQENFPTRGFQSCTSDVITFGLGKHSRISELIIKWPDQTVTRESDLSVDKTYTFHQGGSQKDEPVHEEKPGKQFKEAPVDGLIFIHQENKFVDFKHQFLLPYQLSSNGPCLAKGDINGDGFDDVYIGGAAGQSGKLFLSQIDHGYVRPSNQPWELDYQSEDTDAAFVDIDSDGDLDLIVISGGTEFSHEQGDLLQDRLYLNDGKGKFSDAIPLIPGERSNGSSIVHYDFDHDGDEDLFISGKSLPGYFPLPAYSYLLRNDTKGGQVKFTDVTPSFLKKPGMINSAVWFDYNDDNWKDLILAGDFTPIMVFENQNGKLTIAKDTFLVPASHGLWSKLAVADVDQDGNEDIVAGNMGDNLQFKASAAEPLRLYYHDFNDDGKIDPIVTYFIHGKETVYASRDEMLEQLPHLKKKFVRYADYASADLRSILTPAELDRSKVLTVQCLRSAVIFNQGKKGYKMEPLPVEAQFSRVNGVIVSDFNNDGRHEILLSGNYFPFRVQLGRSDASSGVLVKYKKDKMRSFSFDETGFYASGDVRSMLQLKTPKGDFILLGINSDSIRTFSINKK